jgi:hypothetical protein
MTRLTGAAHIIVRLTRAAQALAQAANATQLLERFNGAARLLVQMTRTTRVELDRFPQLVVFRCFDSFRDTPSMWTLLAGRHLPSQM